MRVREAVRVLGDAASVKFLLLFERLLLAAVPDGRKADGRPRPARQGTIRKVLQRRPTFLDDGRWLELLDETAALAGDT